MAKKFKAHMMYKGKKSVMAKTMADHLRLKKQGYGHKAPSYDEGGKVDEPTKKGHQIPETTVTAALPSELPTLKESINYALKTKTTASEWEKKQHPSMRRKKTKPVMGNAPMVGGAKVLGLGKSAFNLMKSAPSLLSKIAPATANAIGEGLEARDIVVKAKKKFNEGGIMPNVKPDNREDLIVRYNKGGKAKSTVNSAGNYTKPAMRKRLFNRIKAGTKGGRAGQWSARKAQLLAKLYKKNGGGYR